ncbi:Anaerobic glycerol-3-phosphate dehydrogenase subunit A [Budvicia aquatica]|uniref:Anaerobic glycerol-3-phosphate dehydrogenase subunit A n=1 Tax=Budvicia aquatica TaxID=82979 RepID=A0A484ZB88_9GAMM|nr:Anaerobic glycerol-3-phosphate dehydrogenase subunit A [Budvicia aquatica]
MNLQPTGDVGAVRVPDGTVDPFRLTAANMLDAREHGAQVLTYHEVIGLLRQNDRVTGVKVYDHYKKETVRFTLLWW